MARRFLKGFGGDKRNTGSILKLDKKSHFLAHFFYSIKRFTKKKSKVYFQTLLLYKNSILRDD